MSADQHDHRLGAEAEPPRLSWVYRLDAAILRGFLATVRGLAAPFRFVAARHAARHAWDGVAVADCRTCGGGKLRRETVYPLGAAGRFGGWFFRILGSINFCLAILCGACAFAGRGALGLGAALMLPSALWTFGFGLALWLPGYWLSRARARLKCDHCLAITPAATV